ncbi:hypothetical protein PROFUN_03476 [Planoprotostelium fungivorum]|uniref:GATA-type domain-containing protein n=1 Tax=Planoprotostelium fungivorum TaxID=1890364 RepID=A0A2P6MNA3_9EUKA|nr:hypothetical protein PROFUN_03476 [Planoprotostelium fungivorum]
MADFPFEELEANWHSAAKETAASKSLTAVQKKRFNQVWGNMLENITAVIRGKIEERDKKEQEANLSSEKLPKTIEQLEEQLRTLSKKVVQDRAEVEAICKNHLEKELQYYDFTPNIIREEPRPVTLTEEEEGLLESTRGNMQQVAKSVQALLPSLEETIDRATHTEKAFVIAHRNEADPLSNALKEASKLRREEGEEILHKPKARRIKRCLALRSVGELRASDDIVVTNDEKKDGHPEKVDKDTQLIVSEVTPTTSDRHMILLHLGDTRTQSCRHHMCQRLSVSGVPSDVQTYSTVNAFIHPFIVIISVSRSASLLLLSLFCSSRDETVSHTPSALSRHKSRDEFIRSFTECGTVGLVGMSRVKLGTLVREARWASRKSCGISPKNDSEIDNQMDVSHFTKDKAIESRNPNRSTTATHITMTITTLFRPWNDEEFDVQEAKRQKINDVHHEKKPLSLPTEETTPEDAVSDQDLMLGAYLMAHLHVYCENCGTTETPQWRKGWYSDLFKRPVHLCNACGIKYHKSQHCPYCHYIYGKEQEKLSDEEKEAWLTCKSCGRWCHVECERECGSSTMAEKRDSYQCTSCRRPQISKPHTSLELEVGKMFRHEVLPTQSHPVAPSA